MTIKAAQRLGFSLRQIGELAASFSAGEMDVRRKAEVLRQQLAELRKQETSLRTMQAYLSAKLAWVEAGETGPAPSFCALSSDRLSPLRSSKRASRSSRSPDG